MNKKLLKNIAIIAALLLLVGIYFMIKNKGGEGSSDLPVVTTAPTEQSALLTEIDETEAPATDAPDNNATAAPTAAPTAQPTPAPTECPVREDGEYNTKDEVALYIHLYGHLPSNYIKKKDAQELGWPGGSLEPYAPGKSIGGDYFGNYEGLLPKKSGRSYYECDIDTKGKSSRGAKRIIFSNDGLIFYTDDHYESFTEITFGEDRI
jgi:hypothetical protein